MLGGNSFEPLLELFDFDRFLQDGSIIVGGGGSGKSSLAKLLVSKMPEEWLIRVLDVSRTWRKSPVEFRVDANMDFSMLPTFPFLDVVYDLSTCYIHEMQGLVSDLVRREYEKNLELEDVGEEKRKVVWIFEEAQIYLTTHYLRSHKGAEMKRLVTVGRNNDMTYMAIGRKPQLIDVDTWSLCGQQIFGRFTRTRFISGRDILGKKWGLRTKKLKVGQFIYQLDGEARLTDAPYVEFSRSKSINKILKSRKFK